MIQFKEMGLKPEILSAIADLGFIQPTPIQQQTIPHLLNSGEDLIATAQTGTGKTAGFGLPILHHIDTASKNVQAIILCPTRELCLQISKDLQSYSVNMKGVNVTAVYGGASMETQIRSLRKGSHIVVGTPGRTLDLVKRKALQLGTLRWVVLDEADEMLSMGFKEELNAILATMPEQRQMLLFSATMPKDIRQLASKYMKDAVELSVSHKNISTDNVTHGYYLVTGRDRYLALKRIADMHPKIYAIVFCRTRSETKDIADKLAGEGYNADALHGDLSQGQRDFVMSRFRNKQLQLLVATDVAARGLDVNDLSHVINYNLPDDDAVYIHRSGRTGRGDKRGVALSIVHTAEKGRIRQLEKKIGKPIEAMKIPTGKEICEKQLFHMLDKLEKIEVNEQQIESFLPTVYKKLEWLSREELIKRFVSVEFNRFLAYYKDARDLNQSSGKDDYQGNSKNGRKRDYTFARFSINMGIKQKMNPSLLFRLMNQHMSSPNVEIGRIEILKDHSFFEMDDHHRGEVLAAFHDVKYNGFRLHVEEQAGGAKRIDRKKPDFQKRPFKKKSRSRTAR